MLYGNDKYEITADELAKIAGCAYDPDRDEIAPIGFDMYGRPVFVGDFAVSAGGNGLRRGIVIDDDETIDGEHTATISQNDGSQTWVPFSELDVLLDQSPFHSRRCVRDKNGDRLYLGTFVRHEHGGYYTVADFSADKVFLKPLEAELTFEDEITVPASNVTLEDYEPPIGVGVFHWVYPGDTVYVLDDWRRWGEAMGSAPSDGDGNVRIEVVYGEHLDDLKWVPLKDVAVVLKDSPNHYGRYFLDHDKNRVRFGDVVKVDDRDDLYKVERFSSRYVDLVPYDVRTIEPKLREVKCGRITLAEDAER